MARKSRILAVGLEEGVYEALRVYCEGLGLPVAAWVRGLMVRGLRERYTGFESGRVLKEGSVEDFVDMGWLRVQLGSLKEMRGIRSNPVTHEAVNAIMKRLEEREEV